MASKAKYVGVRMPGHNTEQKRATRSKKLLVTKGIATRSKDASRSKGHRPLDEFQDPLLTSPDSFGLPVVVIASVALYAHSFCLCRLNVFSVVMSGLLRLFFLALFLPFM